MKTTIQANQDVSGLIVIPLKQGKCEMGECVVKVGDDIKIGQLLAKAQNEEQLNIYSSVSGHIVAIEKMTTTANARVLSVLIQVSSKQETEKKLNLSKFTKKHFLENVQKLGLLSYDKNSLTSNLVALNPDEIKALGVMVFDEYQGMDLQEYIANNNLDCLIDALKHIKNIFKIDTINFYLPKKRVNNQAFKDAVLKKIKKGLNVNFIELKLSKHKNNYDLFKKYVLKTGLLNEFIQTPETFIDLYKGLKDGELKLSQLVYIGGSATKLNNGYLNVVNGSSLDLIKKQCGGLVFEEQDIDDLKSDCVDCLDDMYDAQDLYKNESDKVKRKELKQEYKKRKSKANAEIWEFVKTHRVNLMKTIKQIRIDSCKFGEIFTDFSPILDVSNKAVFFLNRREC